MKIFPSIVLMIAICVGLLARITPSSAPCGSVVEHCHDHKNDVDSAGHNHQHPCSDDSACPVDGHHHHHCSCCTGAHLTAGELANDFLPLPPSASIAYETLSLLPPDGPVSDLDKPPLI